MIGKRLIFEWRWKANIWYPLMQALVCRRFGHDWRPDEPFLPCCRWCKVADRKPGAHRGRNLKPSLRFSRRASH